MFIERLRLDRTIASSRWHRNKCVSRCFVLLATVAVVCCVGCISFGPVTRTVLLEHHRYPTTREAERLRRLCRNAAVTELAHHQRTDDCLDEDFASGFIDGYADYLQYGGHGEPPAIPPKRYWKTRYQTFTGRQAVQEWYSGFREGALIAEASGRRELITLPLLSPPPYEACDVGCSTDICSSAPVLMDHSSAEPRASEAFLSSTDAQQNQSLGDAPGMSGGQLPSRRRSGHALPPFAPPAGLSFHSIGSGSASSLTIPPRTAQADSDRPATPGGNDATRLVPIPEPTGATPNSPVLLPDQSTVEPFVPEEIIPFPISTQLPAEPVDTLTVPSADAPAFAATPGNLLTARIDMAPPKSHATPAGGAGRHSFVGEGTAQPASHTIASELARLSSSAATTRSQRSIMVNSEDVAGEFRNVEIPVRGGDTLTLPGNESYASLASSTQRRRRILT